eukprot:TRINITY_DN5505_c0_g1_i1.p1 TRINITY_DN5505_c0_g1~~TRINITY_DN5505_c0_g1_i1.p1  ORF type:complete len:232 (+),score=32.06 TRINITY_DN5505_c0_g1_i1:65-760(+)
MCIRDRYQRRVHGTPTPEHQPETLEQTESESRHELVHQRAPPSSVLAENMRTNHKSSTIVASNVVSDTRNYLSEAKGVNGCTRVSTKNLCMTPVKEELAENSLHASHEKTKSPSLISGYYSNSKTPTSGTSQNSDCIKNKVVVSFDPNHLKRKRDEDASSFRFARIKDNNSNISRVIHKDDAPRMVKANISTTPSFHFKGSKQINTHTYICLLYTSPSPRDGLLSRMPSSA